MATLFVRHKVKDFNTWKAAYDSFEGERQRMGVTGQGVYRTDGDPNDITVYHHFDTVAAAKAFAGSDSLKSAMQEAGVTGSPDMWFTEKV